jgi:plastocyanin
MKKIFALVAVAVGVAGCPSSNTTDTSKATPTAAVEATAKPAETVAAAEGPMSSLVATVSFTGTAPAPKKIKKTPECGTDALVDEEVSVKDGKLANVMVRVVGETKEMSGQGAEVTQEKCVYHPRVAGIVAGQSIAVTSKDAFLHNVHTFKGDVSMFNKGQPAPGTFVKEAADFTANGEPVKDGPITFKCDVHPWMVSHVVVNPNPWFAVSGADGVATIKLPAGKHKVEAWHEKYGVKSAEVTVEEGKPAEVKFEYSGSEGKT